MRCAGLLLGCLLLAGCGTTLSALMDAMETRHVRSCVYWGGIFSQAKGVTATGDVPIETCLARLGIEP